MNRKSLSSLCSAVGLVVAGAIFASPASATVTGTLNIANCTGGGVTVSGVAVTWLPPTLGGTAGCINVGAGTTLAYSGGALAPGTFGNILNLPAGPLPVDSFMTFVGTTLDFQLDGIGPANPSNGAACAGLGAGQSCVVALGSPFKLTLNGNGFTDVGLLANGRITDGAGTSTWQGGFTTQLNLSPADIQTLILGGGSITNTHSATFSLTVVPEPSTLVMLFGGVALMAVRRFKRS